MNYRSVIILVKSKPEDLQKEVNKTMTEYAGRRYALESANTTVACAIAMANESTEFIERYCTTLVFVCQN